MVSGSRLGSVVEACPHHFHQEDTMTKTRSALAVCAAVTLAALMSNVQVRGQELKGTPEQLKAIEAWTDALAIQAATYGASLLAMYNLRSSVAVGPNPKTPPNEIWRMEDISTPKLAAESGYVSPNLDVVYGFGFADLGIEPVILTAPDSGGRYYMIEIVDMWTNAFAYPAGGASGYKGGKFALVGLERRASGWRETN